MIILTDKYLNESQWCVSRALLEAPVVIDRGKMADPSTLVAGTSFNRYSLQTEDGVSPRTFPGTIGGQYYNNAYEHEENGLVTDG